MKNNWMLHEVSQETIDKFVTEWQDIRKNPVDFWKIFSPEQMKEFNLTTSPVGYNLEPLAKIVIPFLAPLINRFPRNPGKGGTMVEWKQITAYNSPNPSLAVAEKTAGGAATMTSSSRFAKYKTCALGDLVTWQSTFAGKNFQDPRALADFLLLNRFKVEQDKMALYANAGSSGQGNNGFALGTAGTPTVASIATGGTITNTTGQFAWVKVIALTGIGFWASSLTAIAAWGRSQVSAMGQSGAHAGSDSNNSVSAFIQPIKGAVAYAWFCNFNATATPADSTLLMEAITTKSEILFVSTLGTGQAISAVTSSGSDLSFKVEEFDGVYSQMVNSGAGGSYFKGQAVTTGSVGTGTPLTGDGAGGVVEINVANRAVWDQIKASPNLLLMAAQESERITNKVMSGGNAFIGRVQIMTSDGDVVVGNRVTGLLHKITSQVQAIMIEPNQVAGHIVGIAENAPFPQTEFTNVIEFDVLAGYTEFPYYPTRTSGPVQDFDILSFEALKHHMPAACWGIYNIPDLALA